MEVKPIDGILCKSVAAKCKFCGRILTLWVAEDYNELGDPMKLMKLAACNRCADIKTAQRKLEAAISKECGLLLNRPDEKTRTKIKTSLCLLTRSYLEVISDWLNRQTAQWEEAIVDDMMARPNSVGLAVKTMWAMAKECPTKSML